VAQLKTVTRSTDYYYAQSIVGAYNQVDHTPHSGDTTPYKHSGNGPSWIGGGSGNDISSSSGQSFGGKNGGKNYAHIAIGHDKGIYMGHGLTGFSFSTEFGSSGRNVYMKGYGFSLRRRNNNNQHFHGVTYGISQSSYAGYKTWSHTFNSSILGYLKFDWVFEELHLQLATDNCCGDNTSYTRVYNFRWHFDSGSSDQLIIAAPRPFADRNKYKIA
jgi:hypothetical protein